MSIVVVGGFTRMQDEYKHIAEQFGHKLKVYNTISPAFEKSLGSPDAILVFTNTVSHSMVGTVVRKAKKDCIPVVRSHSSSGSSLKRMLTQLPQQAMACP